MRMLIFYCINFLQDITMPFEEKHHRVQHTIQDFLLQRQSMEWKTRLHTQRTRKIHIGVLIWGKLSA